MDNLQFELEQITLELEELKIIERDAEYQDHNIRKELKARTDRYNELLQEYRNGKEAYLQGFNNFCAIKKSVEEYKNAQFTFLQKQYENYIRQMIHKANSLKFENKLADFRAFDELKPMLSSRFPIFSMKMERFIDVKKEALLGHIFDRIEGDQNALQEKIFNINFLVKFEDYFAENIYVHYLIRKIRTKFEYHFESDRETNRLDKPEWMFSFLIDALEGANSQFELYKEAKEQFYTTDKANLTNPKFMNQIKTISFHQIISESMSLVNSKVHELLEAESQQKRNLILHFSTEFCKFTDKIGHLYGFKVTTDEMSYVVSKQQLDFIKSELKRVHQLNYIMWCPEYKTLIKNQLQFICSYPFIKYEIGLEDLIDLIVFYNQEIIDNFRFVNRDEVKVVCFVFTEMEELKEFIAEEEVEIALNYPNNRSDLTEKSLERLTLFNSNLINLIKTLASNDTDHLLRRISRFLYTSTETKKLFLIECNKILEEYKHCIQFNEIERIMQQKIDNYILDEIIMVYRFESEDYLEFRVFYKNVKSMFSAKLRWDADEGCKVVDAIMEGRVLYTNLYKQIKHHYE